MNKKLEIIEFIKMGQNPDFAQSQKAENYLIKDNLDNLEYHQLMFQIATDSQTEIPTKMLCSIVIKKIISKYNNMTEVIQNFYKQNTVLLIMNLGHNQSIEILCQGIYKLFLLTPLRVNWKDLDAILLNQFKQNQNNIQLLLPLLKILMKVCTYREHSNKKEREEFINHQVQFFMILENLIIQIEQQLKQDLSYEVIVFCELLSKIFCRCYRYQIDDYIKQKEKMDIWMSFFYNLLSNNDNRLSKVKKWITLSLVPFYRNQEPQDDEYFKTWLTNYSSQFTLIILKMLSEQKLQEKTLFNVSRCFFHIIKIKTVQQQYQQQILFLFKNIFLNQFVYNQKELDQFQDDPIEFFKQNDFYSYQKDRRFSIINMVLQMSKNGFLEQILEILIQEFQNCQNELKMESLICIFQNLSGMVLKMDNNQQIIDSVFQQYVLKHINSEQGVLRMRCCAVISTYSAFIKNKTLINDIVDLVCQKLQDKEMPVKSFAAVALEKLLNRQEVINKVRPFVQNLLVIYIDLIKQFQNETIINSLIQILDSFKQDILPYFNDLLQQLVQFIINLMQNQGQDEDIQYSIITSFQTIDTLLNCNFDIQIIDNIMNTLNPLIQIILKDKDVDNIISIFQILNKLFFKTQTFNEQHWNYFEFCNYLLQLNEQKQISNNQLMQYLDKNIEFIEECQTTFIAVFQNFIQKDFNTILQKRNSSGILYIDLLFITIKDLKEQEMEENYALKLFEIELISKYNSVQNDQKTQQLLSNIINNSITKYFQQKENQVKFKSEDTLYINSFFFSFGIFLLTNFEFTINYINQNDPQFFNNIIQQWMKDHRELLSFQMRKSSFLGLTQIIQLVPNSQELMKFLFEEIVIMNIQKEIENDVDNLQDMMDMDQQVQQIDVQLNSIDNIKKFINQITIFNPLESEIVTQYEQESTLTLLSGFDHIQFFKAKLTSLGINQQQLNQILNTLPNEIHQNFLKLINQQSQQNYFNLFKFLVLNSLFQIIIYILKQYQY